MNFFRKKQESEIEYDTSSSSSYPDVESGGQKQTKESTTRNKKTKDDPVFCTKCRCLVMTIIVGIGVTVGASLIFTNSANPLDYWIPVDPPGTKEATRWDAMEGLFLQVEIATDDVWAPIAEQSIIDWNQSEAVILTTRRVPHDPDCTPVNGRLKVCNDDYGDTPWHGINILLVDKNTNMTIHSISKLNDRHNTDAAQRMYIACHENGHGLGLPHTDEDHFNRDRGDCMDYTIRPERNGVPGEYNLNLLEQLYGTPNRPLTSIPGESDPTLDNANNDNNDASSWGDILPPSTFDYNSENENQNQNQKEEEEEEDDDRRRRYLGDDLDDADVDAFEKQKSMECKEEYCIYAYKEHYYVKINQFLAPAPNR